MASDQRVDAKDCISTSSDFGEEMQGASIKSAEIQWITEETEFALKRVTLQQY